MGGITSPRTPFEVRFRSRLGYRQEQALKFMRERQDATLNEISAALGLDGKGHAWNILNRLENRGEIFRDEDGRRRLSVKP